MALEHTAIRRPRAVALRVQAGREIKRLAARQACVNYMDATAAFSTALANGASLAALQALYADVEIGHDAAVDANDRVAGY